MYPGAECKILRQGYMAPDRAVGAVREDNHSNATQAGRTTTPTACWRNCFL